MRYIIYISISIIFIACSVTKYQYVLKEPTGGYETDIRAYISQAGIDDSPFIMLSKGDTIYSWKKPINVTLSANEIIYKEYAIWITQPRVSLIGSTKVRSNSNVAKPGSELSHQLLIKKIKDIKEGRATPSSIPTTSSHTIQTGPRGGQYYINKNGNKTYIQRRKR